MSAARVLQLRRADVNLLSEELRGEVARELRANALVSEPWPALPLPCDVGAEEVVLAAVLSGQVKPTELVPLETEHFCGAFHQALWGAMAEFEQTGDVDAVADRLAANGVRGRVVDELEAIRDRAPFAILPTLRGHVTRLVELARRRALIDEMRELDLWLRTDVSDVAAARAKLGAFFRKVPK